MKLNLATISFYLLDMLPGCEGNPFLFTKNRCIGLLSLSSIGDLLDKFDPELRVVVLNFHDVFFQRMEA